MIEAATKIFEVPPLPDEPAVMAMLAQAEHDSADAALLGIRQQIHDTFQHASDDEGALAGSFRPDVDTVANLARIGTDNVYAAQKQFGGDIYPKDAEALHWFSGGEEFFAHHVYQHPHPFMQEGLDRAAPQIEKILDAAVMKALTI